MRVTTDETSYRYTPCMAVQSRIQALVAEREAGARRPTPASNWSGFRQDFEEFSPSAPNPSHLLPRNSTTMYHFALSIANFFSMVMLKLFVIPVSSLAQPRTLPLASAPAE